MITFRDRLNADLQDPNFKKEWDDLEPEFQIMQMIIDIRQEKGLTQKQLAELAGIEQASLSRIENGKVSPDISTIKKIAGATGKRLRIEFV